MFRYCVMLLYVTMVLALRPRGRTGSVRIAEVHSDGTINARWERDVFLLAKWRTKLACRFSKKGGVDKQLLDSFTVSGTVPTPLGEDVTYEATRQAQDADSTDVRLACSLPILVIGPLTGARYTGVQLMASGKVMDCGEGSTLSRIGGFMLAGPFNFQPLWYPDERRLCLKLGRGAMRHRCPLSLQTDWHPGQPWSSTAFQVGMRQQLGAGRKLRSRLLLDGSQVLPASPASSLRHCPMAMRLPAPYLCSCCRGERSAPRGRNSLTQASRRAPHGSPSSPCRSTRARPSQHP